MKCHVASGSNGDERAYPPTNGGRVARPLFGRQLWDVQLAEWTASAIARPMLLAGHEVLASATVGIALYPDDRAAALTKAADAAMYRAKEVAHHVTG